MSGERMCVCVCFVCECVPVPLTPIVLVEGVHAGEVDGEGLEGRRQADAALRSLHVEARRRARVGRLGQARLGILHAEYGSRRLGRLSAAPHGRSTSARKKNKSRARTPPQPPKKLEVGAKTYSRRQKLMKGFDAALCLSDKT